MSCSASAICTRGRHVGSLHGPGLKVGGPAAEASSMWGHGLWTFQAIAGTCYRATASPGRPCCPPPSPMPPPPAPRPPAAAPPSCPAAAPGAAAPPCRPCRRGWQCCVGMARSCSALHQAPSASCQTAGRVTWRAAVFQLCTNCCAPARAAGGRARPPGVCRAKRSPRGCRGGMPAASRSVCFGPAS